MGLINDYPFEEIMARVPLPVRVETLPPGAEIVIDGKSTGNRTPNWITWNTNRTTEVTLRLRGFDDAETTMLCVDSERIGPELARVAGLDRISWEFHKETIWETSVSGAVEAEPTRVGNQIYIATRNSLVYRVDVGEMELELLYDARSRSLSGFASSPLLHDGHMFLAMVEGKLMRVAIKGGKVAWSKSLPIVVGTVAVEDLEKLALVSGVRRIEPARVTRERR